MLHNVAVCCIRISCFLITTKKLALLASNAANAASYQPFFGSPEGGASLLLAGEEVRAPEARNEWLHAVCDGAGEVDEFVVQPVIHGSVVTRGRQFDSAHEILG